MKGLAIVIACHAWEVWEDRAARFMDKTDLMQSALLYLWEVTDELDPDRTEKEVAVFAYRCIQQRLAGELAGLIGSNGDPTKRLEAPPVGIAVSDVPESDRRMDVAELIGRLEPVDRYICQLLSDGRRLKEISKELGEDRYATKKRLLRIQRTFRELDNGR